MAKGKKEIEETKKAEDKKILKQTDSILKEMAENKMVRHVKEKNEPVFDDILSNFHNSYAKQVVSRSVNEILKFAKNEL